MRIITMNRVVFGIAAVLTVGVAGSASAQATTTTTRSKTTVTSSRRIPVRKDGSGTTTTESAGSIATPNADSLRADSLANIEKMRQDSIANVERMRQDSIAAVARARQDSIAAVERARQDSIAAAQAAQARADSIAAAERERIRQLSKGDVYFRLGAGVSIPNGDFGNVVDKGFNATGSLGWHKYNSPIGIRADVGYDKFNLKSGLTGNSPNVWSGLGEVTLKIPQVLAVSPYAVAGGGFYRFSDDGSGSSTTKGGWNAGGGITFGVGAAKLFLESRYMHVATPVKATTYYPIILGFQF